MLLELRDRLPKTDNHCVDGSRGLQDGLAELVNLRHWKIGFVGALLCEPGQSEEAFRWRPRLNTVSARIADSIGRLREKPPASSAAAS